MEEREERGYPRCQFQGDVDSISVPGSERFVSESSRSPSLRPPLAGVGSLGVVLVVVALAAVYTLAEERQLSSACSLPLLSG